MRPYLSAGLVILQDNKILLVHPKNASWWGTFSIPKGLVNEGEFPRATAIRETEEETGLRFEHKLPFCAGEIIYPNSKKAILYYIVYPKRRVYLDHFKPNDEVDWIGFMTREEALPRILKTQMVVLEYVRRKRTKFKQNDTRKTFGYGLFS